MILTKILEQNSVKYANLPALSMRMGYRTITLSYKQTYDLSCRIALFLQAQGIAKGDKVIIFAPNSPFWVCVFWGVLLNGSIAVPVNVQSTSKMIDKIIDQTEAKILFIGRYLKYESKIQTIIIDFINELTENLDAQDFKKIELNQDDIIEILYTSGTTGDPKGVLLTHKNIYSNVLEISKVIVLDFGKNRILSILPLTHILEQTTGLMLASFYAAHIVYAHSYAAIPDLLCQYRINKIVAVPEFLKVLMQRIKATAERKGRLGLLNKLMSFSYSLNTKFISRMLFYPVLKKLGGKLDTVASGGAPLEPELEKDWESLGIYLLQGYGLTETSPVVALNTFTEHRFNSVGKALTGVQIKIEQDGEILVKGPNVFQGYFKDTEKTTQSFTSDGWFRTGDMGFFDKDNFLFLKGRKKYMILGAGGQNVFPEDIEYELNKITGVKDSCVLGIENKKGHVEIKAVLLLDQNAEPEKIIDQANANLASYQQINSWTIWKEDDFPRSATRKVKRDDVKKVILSQEQEPVKQITTGKSKTTQILSQISGVDTGKITSDTRVIRDLNMDSLMRVELVMRLELELGITIDETKITPQTTVAQLEELINKDTGAPKAPALKHWPRSIWAKVLRFLGHGLSFLLSKILVKLEVLGLENLKALHKPVIFMPNHIGYLDAFILFMAMPGKIRNNLAFAAARDVLYEEYSKVAWLAELFFNSYPLPRLESESIRPGLESTGQLIDKGYSIVIFPEGKISLDGKLQKLKLGTGLFAVEMDSEIVPVKIEGTREIAPYGKLLPRRRGVVKVIFGKPLKFKRSDSYEETRDQIENTMRNL
jgi:long-chain acyl-CoA synthetase